jgi:adenine-specific DNA-methyltransferase
MPYIDWMGKDDVKDHHKSIVYKIIECKEEIGDIDSENMIIKGDNLLALKSLLPYYASSVKMIYIDPPYNTGNTSWVYNDNMDSLLIKKWLNDTVNADDLSRSDKWLCMMYPRLKLLRELLKDDGVIFISIDDAEVAHLRMICDEIFGKDNFIGNIGWESKTKTQNTKDSYNKLQPKIENILVYAKKSKIRFNLICKGEKEYPEIDEKGVFRYSQIEQMNAGDMRGRETMIFEIKGILPKNGKQWKLGYDTVNNFDRRGNIIIRNNKPYIKMRPNDERNEISEPFWGFFSKNIGTAETGKKELTQIIKEHNFETVKPTEIIKRLIIHTTSKDDIILDSFAGSGTTAHAVLEQNKQDGGNRKFILIETLDYAKDITAERVKKVIDGYEYKNKGKITKVNGIGIGSGFKYCELSHDIFDQLGELNSNLTFEQTAKHIYFVEFKKPIDKNSINQPFVGTHKNNHIYFYENKFLNKDLKDLLNEYKKIKKEYKQLIIYTAKSTVSNDTLKEKNIIIRYIPYDIKDN